VSEDGFSCWRVPDRTTMNPAIFGFQPMSTKYAQFKGMKKKKRKEKKKENE